jgi:hypothetical protein
MNLEAVLDSSEKYESIQEKKAEGYEDAMRALEIVKEFIVEKKRVLYGGMSVDISLKMAGHPGIYSDDVIPDYDFYSPEFEKDSYELADILHEAGFRNVNSIGAMHISSRRVRVNDVTVVADISYMPKSIYDEMPVQVYKRMRVVHPTFQRMDMHRAMSMPFENPPFEVFQHRIRKDVKRFKMLHEEYSLPVKSDAAKRCELDEIEVPLEFFSGGAISGVLAYNVMRVAIDAYVSEKSVVRGRLEESGLLASISEKLSRAAPARFEVRGGVVRTTIPAKLTKLATVLTDEADKAAGVIQKKTGESEVRKYNMYGDSLRPRTIVVGSWEVFDNLGMKVSARSVGSVAATAAKVNSEETIAASESDEKMLESVMVVSANGVMLYLLQKYNDYGTPEKEKLEYLMLYQSMMNVVEAAEQVAVAIRVDKDPSARQFYREMPWFLTADSYGKRNESPTYLAKMTDKMYRVMNTPEEGRVQMRPRHGYYPENPDKQQPDFDVASARFFRFGGERVE